MITRGTRQYDPSLDTIDALSFLSRYNKQVIRQKNVDIADS